VTPCISKHGTNIVNRGLKVLFFGLFCYFLVFCFVATPWKRLNIAIFRYFFANFRYFFSLATLEKFLPTPLYVCVCVCVCGGVVVVENLI